MTLLRTVLRGGIVLWAWLALGAWAIERGSGSEADARIPLTQEVARVRAAVEDADSADTLKSLAERLQTVLRASEAAERDIAPQLAQVQARLDQLGPAPEGAPEAPELRAQRQALERERTEADAALKGARLAAEEARQVQARIDQLRARQFGEQLRSRVGSPLAPAYWRELEAQAPADIRRLQALGRQAMDRLVQTVQQRGWMPPALVVMLGLLMAFPLRWGLRRLGRRLAAAEQAPPGRLRRTGLAVWLFGVGTACCTFAVAFVVAQLRGLGAIAPRLETVADRVVWACGLAAAVAALSAALLSPRYPSWRVLPVDDLAARRLRKYAWVAAGVAAVSVIVPALGMAARLSDVSLLTLHGLIGLTHAGLLLAMLVTLARLRAREAVTRDSAGMLALRLGAGLGIIGALAAALLGYFNVTLLVASQVVWITLVVLACGLLLVFTDDLVRWLTSPAAAPGRALQRALGIGPARMAQVGALLSAVLRVSVLLMAVVAISAPFGQVGTVLGWTSLLTEGITLGEAVLKPLAVLRALGAFMLGLAFVGLFLRWLGDTFLPTTGFDAGARNSIVTMAKYLGVALAVLWALAALGLGLGRVALLASALSVGIGFGLQAIAQNFVSGLILLAERPVKPGDRIVIGDQTGDVRRINVRATEIQLDDRSTLIVPNSELITKPVRNLTWGAPIGRVQIRYTVPLRSDVGRLKALLLAVYGGHDAVLATPAPAVYIDEVEGDRVVLRTLAYVGSPRSVYAVRSELLFAVLDALREANLAPPLAVQLVGDAPPAQVSAGPEETAGPATNPSQ